MRDPVTVISSMAPKTMLSELASNYELRAGRRVSLEAAGGVSVRARLEGGERFDVVVLASDAIDELERSSRVVPGSKVDLVSSSVAVAVRAGSTRPDTSTEDAVRRLVLSARSIGCSTGPSGTKLHALSDRWKIADLVRNRIVTPPPGMPVGDLVARGDVELGFQQLSELIGIQGVDVLGPLPHSIQIVTTFSAGIVQLSRQPDAARALIAFLASPSTSAAKRRQGMMPAEVSTA
jgi:molybdate transport system substrate-binding protein